MDKLQMTVTLSADSAPDLLAYLRQIPGARERAFMLKLLAQRGLQMVRASGPDALMWPPAGVGASSEPSNYGQHAIATGRPLASEPPTAAPTPAVPVASHVATSTSNTPPQEMSAESSAPTDGGVNPLAGVDIGALNDAIARFE